MAKSFAITTTATETLRADSQGRAEASFTVTNTTSRPIRGLARVKPLGDTKQEWLKVHGEAERDFAPGATQQFTVSFNGPVPEGASTTPVGSTAPTAGAVAMPAARKYPFRLDVESALNPDEDFTEGPTVNVEIVPKAPSSSARKFPLWLIPVIAVVVIGIGITLWMLLRTKNVEVPNVVGKPKAEATSMLEQQKLKASVKETKVTGKAPAGSVIDQDPPAGGKPVPAGNTVQLVIEGERPPEPTGPIVLINFADSGPTAYWYNNYGEVLPFNGSDGDSRGFVVKRDNALLENNATAVKVIETHPKWENGGNITGRYQLPGPISNGDKFRTTIGFLAGARAGNLHLRVIFNGIVIAELPKYYDGFLREWTVNLSDYAGQSGQFSLQAVGIPTSAQGWICWINPRIER